MEKDKIIDEINNLKNKYLSIAQSLPLEESHTLSYRALYRMTSELSNLAYEAENGMTWAEHCMRQKEKWEEKYNANRR